MQANISDNKGLLGAISCLADRVLRLCSRVESVPGKRLELWAMTIYAVAHLVMAIFHEPWYDEAVAWQIARCASLKDILFEIPHYEGHPPLWHLILLPFAKLGAPYELSLTLVSLIFAGAAVGLIIWRSPFPRIVRLLLPFTYFFFYQYGVISRPYCVMMLAFMLLAMNYHNRNEKPGRYTLCLMLLCLTSAYGIVIAGGLAIVWVWEIWNLQNISKFLKTFPKDKRIWWLAALLALALLLIAEIMPREDTAATTELSKNAAQNGLIIRVLYMLFVCLPDVLFTSVYCDYDFLRTTNFEPISALCCAYLGVLVLVAIFLIGKQKNTQLVFFLPYLFFSLFSGIVYFCLHHSGILLLHFIFWMWISLDSSYMKNKAKGTDAKTSRDIHKLITLGSAISIFISLIWSISAAMLDVSKDYAVGRNVATYISENNLDDYQIMVGWPVTYDNEDSDTVVSMNTNRGHYTDNIAPYFEHNIFYNFMDGEDSRNYTSHKVPTEEESIHTLARWKKQGYPDILYMEPPLELIWEKEELSYDDYTMIYCEVVQRIWKTIPEYGYVTIHIRNDLLDETGLSPVDWPNFEGLY